ncbi:unnamed protein product [marine sediment metagenome]|uniref:Uncharacterized protein n=1 Tax=marine sediment metagenome TaxID=412755 RepID=X1TWX8_9ZZZZ
MIRKQKFWNQEILWCYQFLSLAQNKKRKRSFLYATEQNISHSDLPV